MLALDCFHVISASLCSRFCSCSQATAMMLMSLANGAIAMYVVYRRDEYCSHELPQQPSRLRSGARFGTELPVNADHG